MITADEFLAQALAEPLPMPAQPVAPTQQPTVVYIPAQPVATPVKPNPLRALGMMLIVVVLSVGITLAATGNLGIEALDTPTTVVTVQTTTPAVVLPTAAIAAPVAPVAPVVAPLVATPPARILTLEELQAQAAAQAAATVQAGVAHAAAPVPTTAPVVLNQAVDVPVAAQAAAAPVACTEANAVYTVYRTITQAGQPVGKLSAFSCASLADAEAQADVKEKAIRDQIIANAAQAGTPVVLDAPVPTAPMGEMHGGGGSW